MVFLELWVPESSAKASPEKDRHHASGVQGLPSSGVSGDPQPQEHLWGGLSDESLTSHCSDDKSKGNYECGTRFPGLLLISIGRSAYVASGPLRSTEDISTAQKCSLRAEEDSFCAPPKTLSYVSHVLATPSQPLAQLS